MSSAVVPQVLTMLTQSKSQIAAALPKHIDPDRVMRIAMTEIRNNPKLLNCDPMTVLGSVIQASQLGLEVGSGLGQAYMIPYGNKATLIIGYQGLIELVYRAGKVSSINTFCVHNDDKFQYGFDLHKGGMMLQWTPSGEISTPSKLNTKAVVASAKTVDGEIIYDVMSATEIEKIRNGSPGKNSDPWKNHWGEMAKKTAIRRLYKKLPKSVEMQQAFTMTGQESREIYQDYSSIGQAAVNGQDVTKVDPEGPVMIEKPSKDVTDESLL